MDKDTKIFGNKSLANICEDIYNNSSDKKKKIDDLMKHMQTIITNVPDASILLPIIKEVLEISVRNDEQLVKLANIIQKLLDKPGNAAMGGNTELLPEEEKRQLLSSIKVSENGLTDEQIDKKLEELEKQVHKAKKEIEKNDKKLVEQVGEKDK